MPRNRFGGKGLGKGGKIPSASGTKTGEGRKTKIHLLFLFSFCGKCDMFYFEWV